MEDEDRPRPKSRLLEPRSLDPLGIEDLQAYIEALRAEIVRTEVAVTARRSHRDAMDRFFKSG